MNRIKSFLKKLGLFALILGIAAFCFLYFANYSTGFRAGVPTKFSKKGVIFKTYEGSLNVGGLTNSPEGAIPTTWEFSVKGKDKDVLNGLEEALQTGSRVKLYYTERYFRFFWEGDTKYFVNKVEIINGS